MDIDLCGIGHVNFSFSYGNWKSIREIIIKISFSQVQLMINDTKKSNDYAEEIYSQIMKKMIKNIFSHKLEEGTSLAEILCLYMHNPLNLDALIYYELGGLYALCNKRDNEGYYTPGNSLDICNLLDEIELSVKKYNSSLYDAIYAENKDNVYDCFKRSFENNANIMIK